MDKIEEHELLEIYKKYCKNKKLNIFNRIDFFFTKREIKKYNMKKCYYNFCINSDGDRGGWLRRCKVYYISEEYILIAIDNKFPSIEFRWKYPELERQIWEGNLLSNNNTSS